MRVSREQASQNRERVLDVAARLFREKGFDGIGVADLMKTAGLTHGGFYGQFASKEELMAQACERGFVRAEQVWEQVAAQAPDAPMATVMRTYLSPQHRDNPGEGCVLAALGADVARQGPALRHAVTEGMRRMVSQFAALMPGRSKAVQRERALVAYASMVGALVLARAVDDEALSQEIMDAVVATAPIPATKPRA
jgi:TetR/AcrR family transcriptional repressor of nem operon